ncbi:MAG: hypothetical protein ACON5F_07305 [Jejuia sp.]
MKLFRFCIAIATYLLIISHENCIAQESDDPSLSVGLETLAFKQGAIDVDALRRIIIRKQNELKREGLKRFVFSKLPEDNYTTKLFIQNAITTLIEEHNQDIIEKEILELVTNYTLVIGFSKLYESIYYDPNKKSQNKNHITEYYKSFRDTLTDKESRQLFIDIVGTVMSSNKYLKKRGFFDFDSKINFKNAKLYDKINESPNLNTIDSLKMDIDGVISSYLKSYRYIKDILKNEDYTKLENINDYYLNQVNSKLLNNDLLKAYSINTKNYELIKYLNTSVTIERLVLNIEDYKVRLSEFNDRQSKTKLEKFDINISDSTVLDDKIRYEIENKIGDLKLKFQSLKSSYESLKLTTTEINELMRNLKNLWPILYEDNIFLKQFKDEVKKQELELLKINHEELNGIYKSFTDKFNNIRIQETLSLTDVKNLFNEIKNKIDDFLKLKNTQIITQDFIENFKKFTSEFKNSESKLKDNAKQNVDFVKHIMRSVSDTLISNNFNTKDTLFLKRNSDFFADLYVKTRKLSQKRDFSIDDVLYFENTVMPELVKAKILVSDQKIDDIIDDIIKATNNIIPLMKYSMTPLELEKLNINDDILAFLGFLTNIDKLDKANTFSYILQLLDESHEFIQQLLECDENEETSYKKGICEFKSTYEKLVNGIEKYTLINEEKEVIEIDVLSFLNTFIEQYNKQSRYGKHSLYFSLGFSQNLLLSDYSLQTNGDPENINSIGFASEKIGYKFKIATIRNQKNKNLAYQEINRNDRSKEPNPFINQWYMLAYGSGILYKLANLTTNEDFDFPHMGIGTGIRFYNSLDVNFTVGFPFIDDQKFGNNAFIGVSMDIPIGEYLSALSVKN